MMMMISNTPYGYIYRIPTTYYLHTRRKANMSEMENNNGKDMFYKKKERKDSVDITTWRGAFVLRIVVDLQVTSMCVAGAEKSSSLSFCFFSLFLSNGRKYTAHKKKNAKTVPPSLIHLIYCDECLLNSTTHTYKYHLTSERASERDT